MTEHSRPSRPRTRWLTGVAAAACLLGGALTAPATAAPPARHPGASSTPSGFVKDFTSADREHGAMFRWWWPSSVEAGPAVRQLRQVAAAGYKGVEIAFVMDGTTYPVDPDEHAFGDASWRAAVRAVLAEAQQLGVQVDLTLGGRWPAAVPGLDVGTDSASQELVTGSATVAGGTTYAAAVPAPTPRTYQDRTSENGVITSTTKTSQPTYVTATATRCVADCTEAKPRLDLGSVRDISGAVRDGKVSWTAPAEGTWLVTGYWQRGTAQRNDAPFGSTVSLLSDPESRVVDHFGRAGTEEFIAYFDTLLDPATRRLLKANGGSIFEDSLELKFAQAWTPTFFAAFQKTNGYSVRPYLPALAQREASSPFAPPSPEFAFGEGQDTVAERVLHDVDQTLNDLYLENHVKPVRRWARGLGLTFRAQPYGEPIDLGGAASHLDVTECETLGCSEDQFRTAAAGVSLAGKQVLSSEMLPGGFGNLYGLTQAQITAAVNREYALGANQMVFHGLPYPNIPPSADGTVVDNASSWPGFHGFGANIGEAFGPRQPSWSMQSDTAGYYARMQQTLQTGSARYDVAVLNQALGADAASHDGTFLDAAGYTFGYATPGALRGQKVSRGVLDPGGAGFRALVVGSEPTDLATAREVERLARSGLRIVVVGEGPTRSAGYARDATAAAALDREVRRTFSRIAASRSTTVVADDAGALAALEDEVRADAEVSDPGVKVARRSDGGRDYYVLVNRTDAPVTTDVAIAGDRSTAPYTLDPWTGSVKPVGVYDRRGNRVVVRSVDLEPGAAKAFALAERRFTGTTVAVHAVTTTADDAAVSTTGGRHARQTLTVTDTEGGSVTTRLSDGRVVRSTIGSVPAPTSLTSWDLDLDEWLPGDPDDASDVTRHQQHAIEDVDLVSWTQIPEIKDAVGVGTYTTEITASKALADAGTVLDLGAVSGSYRVVVNGRRLPVADQLDTRIDLGGRLVPGRNTIEVTVASTLLNRLRTTRPSEFGSREPTTNGLLGPVTVEPYRTAVQTVR
ncbi:glycosyl hydrolase [Mumia qirimensis]|uniref:glycosyl hydrolase n=1 Tax=Mumia qirimensis TaxID=3234852 RepID=UPI00351D7D03